MAQLNFRESKKIELPEPIKNLTLLNEGPGAFVFSAAIDGEALVVTFRDFLPSPTASIPAAAVKKIILAE